MNRTRNTGDKENDHKNVNKKGEAINKLLPLSKFGQQEHREVFLRNTKDVKLPSINTIQLKIQAFQTRTVPALSHLSNTQHYLHLYAQDTVGNSAQQNQTLGRFLANHDIDNQLRGRMLDWLIEVACSYKFQPKTYFSSVILMDTYFKKQQERLPISKLHITGVTALVIATKMDEVYPLKIRTVYEKIVHKKIQKRELIEMEGQMAAKLDFCLNVWSFFDLAVMKLHSKWPSSIQEGIREMEQLCEQIAKYMVFDYELSGSYTIEVLADALLYTVLQAYGVQKEHEELAEKLLPEPTEKYLACCQAVLQTVKNFRSNFKSLSNIFKFADTHAQQKVDHFLQSL